VALLLPLSGEHAHIGEQLLDALQLALEGSWAVSWTVVDSEGNADVARQRVNELAADPAVLAIIGPVGVAESTAAAEAAQAAQIPLLTLTSQEGVEDVGAWVFRLRVSPQAQARYMAYVAVDELHLTRFAVLHPDDDYGREAMLAFVEVISQRGAQITAIESYASNESNFTEAVERLVNHRALELVGSCCEEPPETRLRRRPQRTHVDFDALFIPDFGDRVGVILPFLSFWDVALPRQVHLLGLSAWASGGLELSAELAEGALVSMVFHETLALPGVAAFVEAYWSAHGRSPTEAEAQAYDGAQFVLAMLAALSPESRHREGVRDALLNAPAHQGLLGPVHFAEDGTLIRRLVLFGVDGSGYITPYYVLQ
jgi:ABC-type branched-subunit amino acid transport system substrate-binding protein